MARVISEAFHPVHLFEAAGEAIASKLPHVKVESSQVPTSPIVEPMQSRTNTPVLNKLWEIENREIYKLGEREDRKTVERIVYEDPNVHGWDPAKVLGFERMIVNNKTGGRRVIAFSRP